MNKKKKFTCIVSLFFCCKIYAQQVDFVLKSDSFLFESGLVYDSIDFAKQGKKIPSGTNLIFDIKNKYKILPFGGGINTIQVKLEDGSEGFVNVEDLKQTDEDILISQKLNKDKNGYWIDSYNYDIISSASCDVLDKHEPYWKNNFSPVMAEDSLPNSIKNNMYYLASDYFYVYCYDDSRQGFFIYKSQFENEYIKLSLYSHNNSEPTGELLLSKIKSNEQHDLYLKFDGDYLLVYLDEIKTSPDATLVFVSKEQDNIIVDLKREIFANEKISDLSKIIWPRHADGTCDYDDKIIKTHKVGGIYKTEDNIRLRAVEGIAGDSLTTLAAGARVKVEAMGKEETIDGITANWMRVEVLSGAQDKDGNAIEAGTKGWLFGGYVSTVEYAEPTKEERKHSLPDFAETNAKIKTDSATKTNAEEAHGDFAFPFIQVGFGIILTIVLLPIVLVIAKKRKSGKE